MPKFHIGVDRTEAVGSPNHSTSPLTSPSYVPFRCGVRARQAPHPSPTAARRLGREAPLPDVQPVDLKTAARLGEAPVDEILQRARSRTEVTRRGEASICNECRTMTPIPAAVGASYLIRTVDPSLLKLEKWRPARQHGSRSRRSASRRRIEHGKRWPGTPPACSAPTHGRDIPTAAGAGATAGPALVRTDRQRIPSDHRFSRLIAAAADVSTPAGRASAAPRGQSRTAGRRPFDHDDQFAHGARCRGDAAVPGGASRCAAPPRRVERDGGHGSARCRCRDPAHGHAARGAGRPPRRAGPVRDLCGNGQEQLPNAGSRSTRACQTAAPGTGWHAISMHQRCA